MHGHAWFVCAHAQESGTFGISKLSSAVCIDKDTSYGIGTVQDQSELSGPWTDTDKIWRSGELLRNKEVCMHTPFELLNLAGK